MNPPPRVLAHRGDSLHFPENTEAAFRSALEKGAEVLETDLRMSSDGKIVLSHDPDFRRLCGDDRPVSSLKAGELKSMDAGALFKKEENFPFKGQGLVPLLLEEALSLFPDTRFNLDLKTDDSQLADAAARTIRNAGAVERVCVASFHHRVLEQFRQILPEAATSLSKREILEFLLFRPFGKLPSSVRKGEAMALQIPEYAGRVRLISPGLLRQCRDENLAVQIWTVNDPDKIKALLMEGVDGIFSDDPGTLARICSDLNL